MDIDTLLSEELNNIREEGNTIRGKDFLTLSRLATQHGFTDAQFKTYLSQKGITIDSKLPPPEPIMNTRMM